MTTTDQEPTRKTLRNIAGQPRIAACFSSLDGLLSAASRKVEALKQHKKALMQQLFPAAEGD